MRVFKNKAAFTLIEVLLALAIIGLVLTPIFLTQSNVLRRSSYASHLLARIFAAKKMLVENEFALAPDAQEFSQEKKIIKPATTFTYSLKKIPETSALKKFKNVLLESVTIQWTDQQGKKKQEQLVTLVHKPEPGQS